MMLFSRLKIFWGFLIILSLLAPGGLVMSLSTDTQAPSVPTGVTVFEYNTNQMTVSWNASSDISGTVVGYKIYRNSTYLIDVTNGTRYVDTVTSSTTCYEYQVAAYDQAQNLSALSTKAGVLNRCSNNQTPLFSGPTGLNATAVSASQINLSWNSVSGAVSYNVYRNNTKIAYSITQPSYNNTSLAPSTSYSYYVTAISSTGSESTNSATATATTWSTGGSTAPTPTPTPTPTYTSTQTYTPNSPSSLRQLTGSVSSAQIVIAWNDNSNNEDKFNIEKKKSSDSTTSWTYLAQVGTNVTQYTDTAIVSGVQYDYRVQACLSGTGCSGYSTLLNAIFNTTTSTTLSFTNVLADSITSNSARITWTTNIASDSTVEYNLANSTSSIASTARCDQGGNVLSHCVNLTGLSSGANYQYRVKSKDASGNISISGTYTFTTATTSTTDTQPPTAPTFLQGSSLSAADIKLTWIASSDNSDSVGYEVYRGNVVAGTTSLTELIDTNLAADTNYSYTVYAKDKAGNRSGSSNMVQVRTQPVTSKNQTSADVTPPSQPYYLAYTAVDSATIKLTWRASSDSLGVKGYKIYRDKTYLGTTSNLEFLNSGLTAGVAYEYTVSAYDEAGNVSIESSALTVKLTGTEKSIQPTPTPTPDPSLNIQKDSVAPSFSNVALTFLSYESIKLTWVVSKTAEVKLLLGTEAGKLTETGKLACAGQTETDSCLIKDSLISGQKYFYRLRGADALGNVGYSDEWSFTLPLSSTEKNILSAPSGLQGNADNSTVNLFWQDNSATETEFAIMRRSSLGSFIVVGKVGINVTRYSDYNLAPGDYEYSIKACDQSECSAESNLYKLSVKVATSVTREVKGTVVFSGVSTPPKGVVEAVSFTGQIFTNTITTSGNYALNLPIGDYSIYARPETGITSWVRTSAKNVSITTTSTMQTVNFMVEPPKQSLFITTQDSSGARLANAGVIITAGTCGQLASDAVKYSKSTDPAGNVQFGLPAGSYCVSMGIDSTLGLLNPEARNVSMSESLDRSEIFVFAKQSGVIKFRLSGKVQFSDGVVVSDAFVSAVNEKNTLFTTRSDSLGVYMLELPAGDVWKISAKKNANSIAYISIEETVILSSAQVKDLVLVGSSGLSPSVEATGGVTSSLNARTVDGASVSLPSGVVFGSTLLKLSLTPTAEVPLVTGKVIAGNKGYTVNLINESGQAINALLNYAEVVLPFNSTEINYTKVNATSLVPSYFDPNSALWVPLSSYAVDLNRQVVVAKTNHFTLFALVAPADVIPPGQPVKLSVNKNTNSLVEISWTEPEADFHHAKVFRSETKTNSGALIAGLVTGGLYRDSQVSAGKVLHYRVQYVDAFGNESNLSEPLSVVVGQSVISTLNVSPVGTNVIDKTGTIYMISSDGTRRAYTSAGAFLSYGFNTFNNVKPATADDMALSEGKFIPPQDGKIICSDRGKDKNTCYLITGGRKAGFTSENVFLKLGFNFSRSSFGDVSWMESYSNIASGLEEHRPGVLVNDKGTIYLMGWQKRVGFPSMQVFSAWGFDTKDVVMANSADKALPVTGVVSFRNPGELSVSVN